MTVPLESSESHVTAPSTLIRNATILTMNDALDIVQGAVSVRDGRIAPSAPDLDEPGTTTRSTRDGGYLLPGFIQTHIHLCQTLFRGYADDMPLLEWLRTPRLADGSGAHAGDAARVGAPGGRRAAPERHDDGADDGDRARHRRRVRGARERWACAPSSASA